MERESSQLQWYKNNSPVCRYGEIPFLRTCVVILMGCMCCKIGGMCSTGGNSVLC